MLTNNDVSVPLLHMSLLFSGLFILGTLATVPLYDWSFNKLISSKLFTKIVHWIPIFAIFTLTLYLNVPGQFIVCGFIAFFAVKDALDNFRKYKKLILFYYAVFVFFILHYPFLQALNHDKYVGVAITIAFASVLADVFAYFLGNYVGKHKLPKQLNDRKSWEGVAGELIGAIVGVSLVSIVVVDVESIYLFIPIGIGSIVGDLFNSFIKRKINIKEWSNRIPGHGGYLDRFSSLSIAIGFSLYWLVIFNNF